MVRKQRKLLKWQSKAKRIKKPKPQIQPQQSSISPQAQQHKLQKQINTNTNNHNDNDNIQLAIQQQININNTTNAKQKEQQLSVQSEFGQQKQNQNIIENCSSDSIQEQLNGQRQDLDHVQAKITNFTRQQQQQVTVQSPFERLQSQQTYAYLRQQQAHKVTQFLQSSTQYILYICGITGTGKTTTVLNIIHKLNYPFKILNCLHNIQSTDNLIKRIQRTNSGPQKQQFHTFIIDQCDFIDELNRVVWAIRQYLPFTKIILICNRNSVDKIKGSQHIISVHFLPYCEDQLINIAIKKMEDLASLVPKRTLVQSAKMATKNGGDFRQVQKYVTNWAQQNIQLSTKNNERKKIFNINDPFIKILNTFIHTNSRIKNNFLLSLLQLIKQNTSSQKNNKKTICRCKQNIFSKLVKKTKNQLTRTECMFYTKQWEQFGILQINKCRCKMHNRNIQFGDIRIAVLGVNELMLIIKKTFYKHTVMEEQKPAKLVD